MTRVTEPRLACLLLAAGGSRRLGKPKQLIDINGEVLVQRTARLLLTQSSRVTVVIGAHAAETGKALHGLRVAIARNEDWAHGMGGSIAHGMRSFPKDAEGVLILLCDQWRIGQGDLENLVQTWRQNPAETTVARWSESYGSPAIFPASLFDELRQLKGDRGAKSLIARQLQVNFCDIPNAGFDLDTGFDLEMLKSATEPVQ